MQSDARRRTSGTMAGVCGRTASGIAVMQARSTSPTCFLKVFGSSGAITLVAPTAIATFRHCLSDGLCQRPTMDGPYVARIMCRPASTGASDWILRHRRLPLAHSLPAGPGRIHNSTGCRRTLHLSSFFGPGPGRRAASRCCDSGRRTQWRQAVDSAHWKTSVHSGSIQIPQESHRADTAFRSACIPEWARHLHRTTTSAHC